MKVKTKFYIKYWSGLQKKSQSPQEKELELSKGDKLGSEDFGGFIGSAFVMTEPSFEVLDVFNDGIEIITNGLIESKPDGRKDLYKDSHGLKHRINVGQTLQLGTQSMDSSFSVSITPLAIIEE